ncbi:dolichyl-phosphate-mannose protein O-mannosyltransferase-like protein [Encephalitozoon intestinalis ATCC 50506]|uniref:Dolichyl-phosphate-mannose protein O-mannosyltransferase-like protein n=1 Tax=Encephalitozoon intestinalis (strain ATCC 50506) TaxID=876142 RepID=E0S7L6_ENCIT|nr:dolichyl-phosphate-mannose protein O-mannosyltransferase-like protein [Encephalitozoon intestinalis ATCC 50506]ADM11695.1 dolichyl-phosphate-mannose protein O-mannosyltransferase-like protein [Encephalitozoon intestinalis ATCC 50506]UTX45432.1 dolichyl-phosphate-mannose protein O-mannosyltransferase-like protein [Encephalitozoon intestinalis]
MAKPLQTKIKSSRSNQLAQGVLIVILSILLFNKKASITRDETEFIRSLKSYEQGRFCLYKHLPLPGILCHGLKKTFSYMNVPLLSLVLESPRLVSLGLFVVTMLQISWLSQETYNLEASWMVLVVYMVRLLVNTQTIFSTNEMFSICFLAGGIVQIKKKRSFTSGILIGLSVASSWASLCILPPLAIFYGIELFSFAANPVNRLSKAFQKLFKGIIAFAVIPASIYFLSFLVHYSIQNQHARDAEKFSVEFQATLKGSMHEPTDKYLMDRSIVTILNQKHNVYLNMKEGIPSCSGQKAEDSMWMIIKVHSNHSGGEVEEEGRYINHGDLVKMVEFGSNMCLRVVNEDTEDKFRKVLGFVQEDNEANEEDIWQIIGDGPVVSRNSLVRFRHYKTAMDLCIRSLRRSEESEDGENTIEKGVSGSLYSDNKSRLFYISDNRNHDFFKKNFEDGRPKEEVLNFPQKGFMSKMFEHHRKLIKTSSGWKWGSPGYSMLHLQSGERYLMKHDIVFNIFTVVSSFLFPVVLLANHISWKKYDKGFRARKDDSFVCVMYFCAVLMGSILGFGLAPLEMLSTWMMLNLVFLLGMKPALIFFSVLLSTSMRILR